MNIKPQNTFKEKIIFTISINRTTMRKRKFNGYKKLVVTPMHYENKTKLNVIYSLQSQN